MWTMLAAVAYAEVNAMSEILMTTEFDGGTKLIFWCPGCRCCHGVDIRTDGKRPSWTWNGDKNNPTIAPSVLVFNVIKGKRRTVCHLFVREGQIQYLTDCQHKYNGKTIPMEPV